MLCSKQRSGPPACRQTDQNTGSPGEEEAGNVNGVCPAFLEKFQQLKGAVVQDRLKCEVKQDALQEKKKEDSVAN